MLVAVLAASGGYSTAQAQGTGETSDQTALAVPRIGLPGAASVGFPQPLSLADAAQIRRIFALQATDSVAEAARETGRLQMTCCWAPFWPIDICAIDRARENFPLG
jgi:hypothetical protein